MAGSGFEIPSYINGIVLATHTILPYFCTSVTVHRKTSVTLTVHAGGRSIGCWCVDAALLTIMNFACLGLVSAILRKLIRCFCDIRAKLPIGGAVTRCITVC